MEVRPAAGQAGNGQVRYPGPNPSGLPVRRRWGRVAAGIGATVVGAWGFAALYVSADERAEVVVAAADVGRLEVIERGDLRVARVSVEPGIDTIPASQLDELEGRVASTDLLSGALLSPGHLVDEDTPVVTPDEALVGARFRRGEVPTTGARPGAEALVVIRPAEGLAGTSPIRQVEGWLLDVGDVDLNSGEQAATVVVPRNVAAEVTAAAADGRLSVVVLGG